MAGEISSDPKTSHVETCRCVSTDPTLPGSSFLVCRLMLISTGEISTVILEAVREVFGATYQLIRH